MNDKKPTKKLDLDTEVVADLDLDEDAANVRGGASKFNCGINSAAPTQSCFNCSGGI